MSLLRRLMNRNMSLYAQLDALAGCGISLREGVEPAALLARHPEREYETTPFKLLLTEIGREPEEPPHDAFSANVWLMRSDCISGAGDYAKVANHLAALAGDMLPLESLRDEFDIRNDIAWLAFTLRGESFRWPAKIEERWIDPNILSRFAVLLEAQGTEYSYTCLDLGGQECLLGCTTQQQFDELRRMTGLAFEWLG
jgi:hypothetical protein